MHETPNDEFHFSGSAPGAPNGQTPSPLPVDGLEGLDGAPEPPAPLPSEQRPSPLSEILSSTPPQHAAVPAHAVPEGIAPHPAHVAQPPVPPQADDGLAAVSFDEPAASGFHPAQPPQVGGHHPVPPPSPEPHMTPGPLPSTGGGGFLPEHAQPVFAPATPPPAPPPVDEFHSDAAAAIELTEDPPPAPIPSQPVAAPEPAPAPAPAPPPTPPRRKVRVEIEEEGASRKQQSVSPRHLVQDWLGTMVESKASDLILRSGGRPSQRLDGKISFLPGRVPGPGPMLEVLRGILGEKRMETFMETGSADAALDLDGLGRFRINAYKQMGEPAVVIRRINEDAPSLEDLNLPADELKELSLRKRGLVLVTGVAGSGKSTTLSAMIEFMNRNVERHVVTLEDPVELLFKEKYCVISQREVGTDTVSFKQGLKHALRQSPDVILIGEMRDAETVLAALEAIETGHLVMSTMHTVNAAQTVDRILGFFPAERHVQIRQRMADTLAGVLSMRLVQRSGGGLVPAYELMTATPQVRELLEEGKTTELGRVIQAGMERGLVAFNDCLADLVQSGLVELDDAVATSDRPDELL
ncbi:MAG: PilT/PilU family type 4a pilus ATPase, partial [Planctomycetota bacterium]